MVVLVVVAVLGVAVIDGGYMLKGRKTKEVLTYGGIVAIALGVMILELIYFEPFIVTKVLTIFFRPISEPLLIFLRQH